MEHGTLDIHQGSIGFGETLGMFCFQMTFPRTSSHNIHPTCQQPGDSSRDLNCHPQTLEVT